MRTPSVFYAKLTPAECFFAGHAGSSRVHYRPRRLPSVFTPTLYLFLMVKVSLSIRLPVFGSLSFNADAWGRSPHHSIRCGKIQSALREDTTLAVLLHIVPYDADMQ